MTSFTYEQKLEARKARDRAFRARCKAFRAAADAAELSVETEHIGFMQEVVNASEKILEERNAALDQINEKIAELEKQRDTIRDTFAPLIDAAFVRRKEVVNRMNREKSEARFAVEREYIDVANCYSAAAWKPIEEFISNT